MNALRSAPSPYQTTPSGYISSFSTLSGALDYTHLQASAIRCLPPSTIAFQAAGHVYRGIKLSVLKNGTSDPSESLEGADDYLGPWYTHNRITVRVRWSGYAPYTYSIAVDPTSRITRAVLGQKVAIGMMNFISGHAPQIWVQGQGLRRLMIKDVLVLSTTNVGHSFWEVEIAFQ
ncbi:hypothetical protein AX16_009421 [Volvariella volvacea WC 439]|nr:hypothetical protein AX16_009421 [Volvariella volvacea WC 439]